MDNIHASCVSWQDKGIMLLGKSGLGKSDLCLRLIQNHEALLVADDRAILNVSHETIIVSAPDNLKGMLEVRGVGILQAPHCDNCSLNIVVELLPDSTAVERFPDNDFWIYNNIKVPLIRLYAFDVSAANKIIAAVSWPKAIK